MMALIDEACGQGARLKEACRLLEITARTLQRWREGGAVREDGRKVAAAGRIPANRLSPQERRRIVDTANRSEFADRSPHQIVPALADRGEYIASEASFYRVLKAEQQLTHRGKAKPASRHRPRTLEASGPNQVWSWDITYLASTVCGMFFYLYLFLDVYSRKIVGWEVHAHERAEYAADIFGKICMREEIDDNGLVLHSDNGAPMKGATMLATLQKLGVVPSFSRPSVSNDNAYSESLFRTLKYQPGFPEQPFESVEAARAWTAGFVQWYNEEHRHSAIRFVTPAQRHRGEDHAVLLNRKALYEAARAQHPERWSGSTRNWEPIGPVSLNPGRADKKESNNRT